MLKRVWNCSAFRNFSKSSVWRNSDKPAVPESPKPETSSAHSVSSKFRPTNFEKKVLVYSGRFKSESEIPEFIAPETLDNAQSKLRIRIANVMMVITAIAFIFVAYKGKQSAEAGDSLLRRGMERDARVIGEYKQKQKDLSS